MNGMKHALTIAGPSCMSRGIRHAQSLLSLPNGMQTPVAMMFPTVRRLFSMGPMGGK